MVPTHSDFYYSARPSIAIARPGEQGGALPLNNQWGLHPLLQGNVQRLASLVGLSAVDAQILAFAVCLHNEPLLDDTADLLEWRRTLGIKCAPLAATRTGRDQRLGLIDWLTTTRPFERVIVADTLYESTDPRVTVHRRVTR